MSFQPKVSIVIPVYNGANYLGEAIDSALEQTYENLEVIVVNDGSNDDDATRQIALSYGDRIRYFEKENGGVSSALNLGIKQMTGEYFSWLSHDDKYESSKVYDSVKYLEDYSSNNKLITLCSGYYIDNQSRKIRDMRMDFETDVVYSGIEVLRYLLTNGVLDACCMLIPKTAFDECGFFNEDLRYNQDALMWYSIFSKGYSMVVQPENKNVMYRLHSNQTSKTRRDLLLRDSYELSKIISPVFAALSDSKVNLLKMFAIRNARIYCKNAVNETIRIGKEYSVLSLTDVLSINCRLVCGYFRNIIKKVYHKVLIK